jgi:hypothetical protein
VDGWLLTFGKENMWPHDWITGTEAVSLELEKWRGGVAQGWEFSVSHSQLLVRLSREEGSQRSRTSLYLYLKDCYRVSFDDAWRDVHIQIKEQEGEFGTEYVLTDSDRFYTHCGVTPFAAESETFLKFPSLTEETELPNKALDTDA